VQGAHPWSQGLAQQRKGRVGSQAMTQKTKGHHAVVPGWAISGIILGWKKGGKH